jgi:hypothetical protein
MKRPFMDHQFRFFCFLPEPGMIAKVFYNVKMKKSFKSDNSKITQK